MDNFVGLLTDGIRYGFLIGMVCGGLSWGFWYVVGFASREILKS